MPAYIPVLDPGYGTVLGVAKALIVTNVVPPGDAAAD